MIGSAARALALRSFGCSAPGSALVEARIFGVVDEALCRVVVPTGRAYPEREQLAVFHQFFAVEPWATNQALKVAFQV